MSSVSSIQIILFSEEQKRVVEGKNDARCHRELERRLVPIRNDVRHSRKKNSHILIIVEKRCNENREIFFFCPLSRYGIVSI